MWNKFNKGFSSVVMILAFTIAVIFSSSTADAQSLWKQNTNNPSTSGTTLPQNNGSDKTPIFIAMGAVVLGYVLYKVAFEDNSDIEDTTRSDSSASLLIPSHSKLVIKTSNSKRIQNSPPVNLYLGIRRDNYNTAKEEKTYIVGVSVNF